MTKKLDNVKIKNFCSPESIIKRVKRQPRVREKTTKGITNKGLILHPYK